MACDPDNFQGIRFYDGSSFGYLRVYADKAELIIGDETLTFVVDGTVEHTYRITGQGRDINLYVDGQLAIDGTGEFTSHTTEKVIEFGDIAGKSQNMSSSWSTFKYSVLGAYAPNSTTDAILEDVASFPSASIGRLKEYKDRLYVSVDPVDQDKSSSIYSFREGYDPEPRSAVAITRASVSTVLVDPARSGNVFGTSGKILGTDRGVQYLIGSKPFPFDSVTQMSSLPSDGDWAIDSNCVGTVASVASNVLTIDTTPEVGARFFKYTQDQTSDFWVSNADNSKGWTVETRVKIVDDGSGGAIDASAAAAATAAACDDCGQCDADTDDGLRAPGVFINDGTYQEFVQFFQRGVRLMNAKLFGTQDLSSQFYTVRIIGKGTSIAVYAKGDSESSFRQVLFASDGLKKKASSADRQERPCSVIDSLGCMHTAWQDSSGGNFSIFYSKLVGSLVERGSGMVGTRTIDVDASIINSRIGFGLPPAAPGIDYTKLPQNVVIAPSASFVKKNARPGDILCIFGKNASPRNYVIAEVLDEILLKLDTSEDLGGLLTSEWTVTTAEQAWLPPTRVSLNTLDSVNPRMIIHSSGDVFVAYSNNENGNDDIFVRRGKTDPFGVTWTDTVRVTRSSRNSTTPDLIELPSGNLYVVWEDSSTDSTSSLIFGAHIPFASFGAVTSFKSFAVKNGTFNYRDPRLARFGNTVIVAYEDQTQPIHSIMVSEGTVVQSIDRPVTYSTHTTLSSSTGQSRNPSICSSPDGSFCVTWEDHAYVRGQIVAATRDTDEVWTSQFRISNSRGSSREPSVVSDGSANLYIVFSDDRTRTRAFELYSAKYDAGSSEWLCSGQRGLDTKIRTYMTDNRRPSVAVSVDGDIGIAWETFKDNLRTLIAGSLFDGDAISMDDTVVAYFPLDDDSSSTEVQNKIRRYNAQGSLSDQLAGTAFVQTDTYSVESSTPGASLFAPEDQKSFDLSADGNGFTIPGSLINTTGAIDLRLRPHWHSTAPGDHVFFGNASLAASTMNTIVCGVTTVVGGSELRLRIVDSLGVVHQTSIDHNHFQWDENEDVFLRAVWDHEAIGVSSITGLNFPTASVGYACGYNGIIFKTADAGATWTKQATPETYDLYSIAFTDADNGVAVGEFGTILKTIDGGTTWEVIDEGVEGNLNGVSFRSATVGIIVGSDSVVLTTTDGGDTWVEETFLEEGVELTDVSAIGAGSIVIAVATGGRIYRSSNAGAVFVEVTSPVSTNLSSVTRSPAGTDCYIAGANGVVLASDDIGVTWTDVSPSWTGYAYKPSLYDVSHAGTAGVVWVVGQGGAMARSTDNGANWTYLSPETGDGALRALEAYFDGATSNQVAVAAGIGGLVVFTSNAGSSFGDTHTRSSNLTIYVNGKAPEQTRTNDEPFEWTPTADVVVGDYVAAGTSSALAVFDEMIIYKAPPPNLSAFIRQEVQAYQADVVSITSSILNKSIEWGSISPDIKTTTLWKEFKMFTCGAKEPLLHFAWDSTIGLVDDVIRDFALVGGKLWIATENGVSRMDVSAANECINAWMSGRPLPDVDLFENYTNLANSLVTDSVSSICADSLGNIWCGTDKGIMMLPATAASTFSETTSDSTSTVGDGTVINDSSTTPKFSLFVTTADGLPSNRVNTIRANGTNVFVGTDSGLAIINASGVTATTTTLAADSIIVLTVNDGLPSNEIKSISFDEHEGRIWIGTNQGAVDLKPGCNKIVGAAVSVKNSDVYSITIDGTGRKFIGTRYGLTKIDGVESLTYTPSSGLASSVILGGSFDAAGVLWLATSAGLVEFDEDCDRFTSYGIPDGIIGDPSIVDYQHFRILGGPLPFGGCDKALVTVAVNGTQLADGFSVNPAIPSVYFDTPLLPSDKLDVCVNMGWRRVRDFNSDRRDSQIALLETDVSRFRLYRKRFPAGAEVVLGGNFAQGASNTSTHMYVVFVSPISASGTAIGTVTQPAAAVVTDGVLEGASVYEDLEEAISVLPTGLVSTQMISMTSTDSAEISDQYLIFDLVEDAVVYVAYDERATNTPSWLRLFEPVRQVLRVSDLETFTDGSGDEKLFVATSGTTGCVYDILLDPEICDPSAQIAMDATPPVGCATITSVSATDTMTLKLTATDAVTGVVDMQISARPDFTTDGETDVPFETFQSSYVLTLPPTQTNVEVPVVEIEPEQGVAVLLIENNGVIYVGTELPGNVYTLNKVTQELDLLFETGEDRVLSICPFGQYLIVGTGDNGTVFSWDGTTLAQVGIPVGEKAVSMAAFNNRLFIGTSPLGKIYELDSELVMTLFRDTNETSINGFAVFNSRLYFVTSNDSIEETDVLTTTTTLGHRHTYVVQNGETRLEETNGTSSDNGHTHLIVNGIVEETDGHTHVLNGIRSGKVFSYDVVSQEVSLKYADRDYSIKSISAVPGTDPVMFVGTSPNGRIIRYISDDDVFIKSFDTTATEIRALKAVGGTMYAAADEDIFFFDGTRWQFSSGSDDAILDFAANGDSIYLLKGGSITTSKPITVNEDKTLCAYVKFRDAAGNETSLTDSTGKTVDCYNPCVKLKDVISPPTGETPTGTPSVSHRIVEIDSDANVLSNLTSHEAFYSGEKVEEEVGIYESEVFNGTNSLVQWVDLTWQGVQQTGSSITIAVRSARTQAAIVDAEWGEEFTNSLGNDLTNIIGQFIQFRATLKVTEAGVPSPTLSRVDIQLKTSQSVHYFSTNFVLPDELRRGILTYNGCINPPVTDIVFGISGLDTTNFSDYMIIEPDKVFELTSEHQTTNLRIGIKLISSPTLVPYVDEFALLFSLANDAIVKLNLADQPGETFGPPIFSGATRTVSTDQAQGHVHTVTFDSATILKSSINGVTSTNAGHSHAIVDGVIQPAAGHTHDFAI